MPSSNNVGHLLVFVSSKSTLCIIQTATVTAIDMISNIGGTLGLFTGVSLLSAAELVYWTARYLGKKLRICWPRTRSMKTANHFNI